MLTFNKKTLAAVIAGVISASSAQAAGVGAGCSNPQTNTRQTFPFNHAARETRIEQLRLQHAQRRAEHQRPRMYRAARRGPVGLRGSNPRFAPRSESTAYPQFSAPDLTPPGYPQFNVPGMAAPTYPEFSTPEMPHPAYPVPDFARGMPAMSDMQPPAIPQPPITPWSAGPDRFPPMPKISAPSMPEPPAFPEFAAPGRDIPDYSRPASRHSMPQIPAPRMPEPRFRPELTDLTMETPGYGLPQFAANMPPVPEFPAHPWSSAPSFGSASWERPSRFSRGCRPCKQPAARPATETVALATAAVKRQVQDSDRDGVENGLDMCPNSAAGSAVDAFGCDDKTPIVLRGVNFHTDSDQLTETSSSILDKVATTLTTHPELKVEVAGHTDSDGVSAHNKELSQRRAEMVKNYLINKGVTANNLVAMGYGEGKPIGPNDSAAGKATNRRVELARLD